MSTKKRPFSPVDEFIKTFNEMSARYSRNELWYNYIDMHAIALANTCDSRCRDAREEQYNAIVQKYDDCESVCCTHWYHNDGTSGKPGAGFSWHRLPESRLNQKPSRAVFHAVQCRADDGTHKHAGFSCSGQVPYPAGERPVLWCRMPASGGVQCDARAVGTH